MRTLFILLFFLFLSCSVSAEQALVLTEIEQLQEKVWYLQRDLSSQKTDLEKSRKELTEKTDILKSGASSLEEQTASMTLLVKAQQQKTEQLEKSLQSLEAAIASLTDKINQQSAEQLQHAQTSGSQQGLLQTLRNDVAANRKNLEKVLETTQQQLSETKEQLMTIQKQESNRLEQLGLYLGGAALGLAILLTISLIIINRKSKQPTSKQVRHTTHEL